MWEKKDSKKGFTLVELIVVLVILAILAAIMVPALIGWIDKAKEKQAAINGRTVYLAAQTIASEKYAKATGASGDTFADVFGGTVIVKNTGNTADSVAEEIALLAAVTDAYEATITAADGVVSKVVYKQGDMEEITIGK